MTGAFVIFYSKLLFHKKYIGKISAVISFGFYPFFKGIPIWMQYSAQIMVTPGQLTDIRVYGNIAQTKIEQIEKCVTAADVSG